MGAPRRDEEAVNVFQNGKSSLAEERKERLSM
jgi:hypothetical protein